MVLAVIVPDTAGDVLRLLLVDDARLLNARLLVHDRVDRSAG
jgi:hypothetical protein